MAEESYIVRMKRVYNSAERSRLVMEKNTKGDSVQYFQKQCNLAQPRDEYEQEVVNAVRQLMAGTKRDFIGCLRTSPHFVLVTDARTILEWFRLENVVKMRWNDQKFSFEVRKDERELDTERSEPPAGRGRGGRGRVTGGRGRGRGADSRGRRRGADDRDHGTGEPDVKQLLSRLEEIEKKTGINRSPSIESLDSDEIEQEAQGDELIEKIDLNEDGSFKTNDSGSWFDEVEKENP